MLQSISEKEAFSKLVGRRKIATLCVALGTGLNWTCRWERASSNEADGMIRILKTIFWLLGHFVINNKELFSLSNVPLFQFLFKHLKKWKRISTWKFKKITNSIN